MIPDGAPWPVASSDGELVDPARDRSVPFRAFVPTGADHAAPVVLVSHGGSGNRRGFTRGTHLGEALAAAGFVAIHVGHLESTDIPTHLADRPADIGTVLDALEAGRLALPVGFVGTPDLERVGHTGHSFGAYTSHAVGGAVFTHGRYADPRIAAIAPISPQGADGPLGSFDDGGDDHTWAAIEIPSLHLIGEIEIDSNAVGTVEVDGWRLQPFTRIGDQADRFQLVLEGQDHGDMYHGGSEPVKGLIAGELVDFFLAYLADDHGRACDIGIGDPAVGLVADRRPGAEGTLLADCR